MNGKTRIVLTKRLLSYFSHLQKELAELLQRNIDCLQPEWFAGNSRIMEIAQRRNPPIWPSGMDCTWETLSLVDKDNRKLELNLEFIPFELFESRHVIVVNAGDRSTYPGRGVEIYNAIYPDCLEKMQWQKVVFGITDGHHRV